MKTSSKRLFREFSLARFYCILLISVSYFLVQLQTAYSTHSLILQIDSYHMLYNVLSLITCILTIRFSRKHNSEVLTQFGTNKSSTDVGKSKANELKNTFGWARIDVFGVVANLSVLLALCTSVVVDALQTIFHACHHHSMTDPIWVAVVAAIGFGVNAICFWVIGGYTFHQKGFLSTNLQLGDDVVISASVQNYVHKGLRTKRHQGLFEVFRDIFGTVLVLACAIILIVFSPPDAPDSKHTTSNETVTHKPHDASNDHQCDISSPIGYVDPALCIATAGILMWLSYSYAKNACRVMLLTIPDHINVHDLVGDICSTFPEISNIHDLHLWQLTPGRVIATAHIVLKSSDGYLEIRDSVVDFLHSKGISHITLQPEFLTISTDDSNDCRARPCFLPCGSEECRAKKCCEGNLLPSESPCDSQLQVVSLRTMSSSNDSSELTTPTTKPAERYPEEAIAVLKDDLKSDEETELHPMI